MKNSFGVRVLLQLPPGTLRRLPRPQPIKFEKRFVVQRGARDLYLTYEPWVGYFFTSAVDRDTGRNEVTFPYPPKRARLVKRVPIVTNSEVVRAPLPHESKTFLKYPTWSHFMVDTEYDDKTARMPGYTWVFNRGTLFEAIMFNPDAGGRLPVVAGSLDDLWAAMEAILRAPDALWSPDNHLLARLTEKPKKNKR